MPAAPPDRARGSYNMPIYQYACRSCGHSLESLQKISDEPLKVCPNCDAPELAKQLTAAAFKLKGTGWYETDFKNSGKKDDPGSDTKKDASKDSKDKKSGGSGDNVAKPSAGSKSSESGSGASASGN